jgi:predicted DNA-binding WGR domain protein
MTAITLRRRDPARNLHRYYRLDVQLDLFGDWCFLREWGRIGSAGQTRTVLYPTPEAAQAALERQRRKKEQRGYTCTVKAQLAPRSELNEWEQICQT